MDTVFQKLIKEIAEKLIKQKFKLSIAESCTGGFISNALTNLPGASKFFDMSIICYSLSSKSSVLGISSYKLSKSGTVSEEIAAAMAKSVRKMSATDISLSVTGVAGPEKIENKGVGLIYMAVALEDFIETKGIKLSGDREDIKKQASLEALKFLNQVLRIWL
jgi:PncC family amidohydrolase